MSVILATKIVDLRDAHLLKKNIWNGEKGDGVDQNIVSEVVQSTIHGRSSPSYGLIKPVTEQTRNYFPRLPEERIESEFFNINSILSTRPEFYPCEMYETAFLALI